MFQNSNARPLARAGSGLQGLLWAAIGFFWAPVSFPALGGVFALAWRSWHLTLTGRSVTGGVAKSLALLAFLTVYYCIFGLHEPEAQALTVMMYRTVSLWLLYLFAFAFSTRPLDGYRIIAFYSIGMLVKSAWVVFTSLATDPILVAARQVLDPFTGEQVNSIGYSNMAALAALAAIGGLVGRNSILAPRWGSRLVIGTVLAVALTIAIILQARTFFLVVAGAIAVFLWRLRKSAFVGFVVALGLVASLVLVFGDELVEGLGVSGPQAALVGGIASRFSEKGLESPRYELWAHGVPRVLEQPGGGVRVDSNLYGTKWLHNLWLDAARTSSLFAVALLIAFQLMHLRDFIGLAKRAKEDADLFVLLVLCVGTFAIAFTSIPLEGDLCIFGLFVILHGVVAGLGRGGLLEAPRPAPG